MPRLNRSRIKPLSREVAQERSDKRKAKRIAREGGTTRSESTKAKAGKPWKQNVSSKARKKRFQVLRADSIWSQAVRARDDHTCRRCGKRDEVNNQAHHIAPRSRRRDLKYVLENGATVCPDCHSWIHSNPREADAVGLLSFESREKARKDVTI